MYTLFCIKICHDNDNIYRLIPDTNSIQNGAKQFAIKATPEMLLKFLKRCGSADDLTKPRSKRSLTYKQIISNILNGEEIILHIFGHRYPKSYEELKKLII